MLLKALSIPGREPQANRAHCCQCSEPRSEQESLERQAPGLTNAQVSHRGPHRKDSDQAQGDEQAGALQLLAEQDGQQPTTQRDNNNNNNSNIYIDN